YRDRVARTGGCAAGSAGKRPQPARAQGIYIADGPRPGGGTQLRHWDELGSFRSPCRRRCGTGTTPFLKSRVPRSGRGIPIVSIKANKILKRGKGSESLVR